MRHGIIGLSAVLALCAPQLALAGTEPVFVAAPDWVHPLGMPATPPAESSTPLLLDRQVRLTKEGVTTYFEAASKINSAESLTRAVNLQLTWHPDKGDLNVHRIELIRPSGTVDVLKSGQKFTVLRREAQLEQLQVNGLLTATMQIEGAQVGDTVRLAFSISYRDPVLGGNVNTYQPLNLGGQSAVNNQLRVIWDDSLPIRWKLGDPRIKPRLTKKDGLTELLISGNIPKYDPPPGDAPARYRQPPILELSSFPDWKTVSRVNRELYDTTGQLAKDDGLKAEVAKIAATTTDPRTRAAMALQLVQDKVRYLFNGMALGAYVPASPKETWSRKFGDCKAKTFLLLTILRELGIEAEPMLVSATTAGASGDRLPSFQAFDHIVARAKVDGKWLWLDGTSLGDRIADLEDVPAFGFGLPVRAGGAELEPLVAAPMARPNSSIVLDFDARAGLAFPAPFTFRQTLRGQSAMLLRASRDALGAKEFATVQKGVIQQALPDAPITDQSVSFDDASGEAIITAKGIANMSWSIDEGRRAYQPETLIGNFSISADRSAPDQASVPVATDFPTYALSKVTIQLPDKGKGFAITGAPRFQGTIGGIGLSLESSLTDGVLSLSQSSRAMVPEVAAASLADARAALAKAQALPIKIAAPTDYPDRKKEIAAAKADGRLKPLIAAYARLIPADDQDSTPFLNRARFYAGIDDNKRALTELAPLIARAPNAENYLWRASLRGKDDVAGAIADIKAARALEPTSSAAINQLVALRIASKDTTAALSDIDGAMDTGPDKAALLRLKATVLEEAKRLPEALAALDKAIALAPGTPDILNERCWMKATNNTQLDTALRDCTKAIEQMDEPAAALDSRGFVYLRMGRFEDAISDFDAALTRNPELGPTLFVRGIARLRKGDKTGGDADLANARRMVPDIDKTYAKYGVAP